MRHRWFVVLAFALASCGQPLATSRPTRPATPTVPRSTRTVPVTATVAAANPVPTLAPSPVEPTVLPTALPISTVTVIPQAGAAQSSEQRWRAQQLQREVFDPPRIYVAHSRVPLLWYDPATGQSLEVGTLLGEFPVQAQFVLRDTGQVALEVPYRINVDFGLTAISEAVRSRMVAAGYAESVEAYIVHADVIQPK